MIFLIFRIKIKPGKVLPGFIALMPQQSRGISACQSAAAATAAVVVAAVISAVVSAAAGIAASAAVEAEENDEDQNDDPPVAVSEAVHRIVSLM